MIRWISVLSANASAPRPGFLVIGQNATSLLADDGYVEALDGVAQEDVWFTGADGGPEGDCPVPRTQSDVGSKVFLAGLSRTCRKAFARERGGAMHFPGESEIVPLLERARALKKPIFTVDYALESSNVAWVAARSRLNGFVPFVGARSLSSYVPPLRD